MPSPRKASGDGWRLPLADASTSTEDVEAVLDCLRSGWLTMGPRTQALEEALTAYLGARHVATVASGTAALHLALLAAGVEPGDEVAVPALASVETAAAAPQAGARLVICDARGPHDLNIDVDDARGRVTARTKAVIAVHLCGYPADVSALRELCDDRGIALIEDCTQALGGTVREGGPRLGTAGDLAAFSFSSKQQLYVGEGGMVASADDEFDRRVRLLRSHALTSGTWDRHRGHDPAYDVVDIGFNYRLDEPRAALALSRLPRVDDDVAARRKTAAAYRKRLSGLPGLGVPWDDRAARCGSHSGFVALLPDEVAGERIRAELRARGVQTGRLRASHGLGEHAGCAPVDGLRRAAGIADRSLMLPLSASMDEDAVDGVVDALRQALRAA